MNIFINDRSNLDEVVSYNPATKVSTTRRAELAQRMLPRRDVVLINDTRSGQEYVLYVCHVGYSGDLWILDMLSDEAREDVDAIAERMRYNLIDCPNAAKLLADGTP